MGRISMIVWNDVRNDARVLKEAATLQSAGHKVTIFAILTPGKTPRQETLHSGVRVVRVARGFGWNIGKLRHAGNKSGRRDKGSLRKLVQIVYMTPRIFAHASLFVKMVVSRPDVVHGHDVNTLPTAWLVSKFANVPLVYDAHEISTDREGYSSFRSAVAWVEKRLMPRAAAAITTTEARAKFFARAYGVPRPLVLQNRPRYSPVERTDRIRRELALNEPWPIVLYQGNLQSGRGLTRLVDAASDLTKVYVVFIGDGKMKDELEAMAQSKGLTERVHFVPAVPLDELPSYTESAEIGVQPIENTCLNHYTTDSNKLFEYVIGGLAIVASSLPEIRKIVDTHDLGITVAPDDTKALAEGIKKLVDNEELRRLHAEKAKTAALHLNWEDQEHRLVKLYETLT
tara:strand:+ start:58689 stop:59888 length:1200 start_codon:yes stop_codon:yes gene_type:complete